MTELLICLAIACYQHYDICGQSSTCLVDANKKNCTGEDQNYCAVSEICRAFTSDRFPSRKMIGSSVWPREDVVSRRRFRHSIISSSCLADAAYCNSTLLLGIRHCCETDYCNQAVIKHRTTWLTVFIALLVTRGAFSH